MFEKGASSKFKKRAIGIVILGFFIMYFSCCLASDALNIIQPAFKEHFGWSYTAMTMPVTIGGYIVIAVSFFYSTIILKKGTRMMGTISFVILGIATLMIAFSYKLNSTSAIIIFSIGLFLTKMFVVAIQLVCFQLCANWFETTRGRIMGIITIGAPLNSATSITLLTKATQQFGFFGVYVLVGVILILLAVVAYIYGISTPEELGMVSDGVKKETVNKDNSVEFKTQWTLKKILATKESWFLAIGFGFFNFIIPAVMANFIVRMLEIGMEMNLALVLISTSALLGIPIAYAFGWLDDKIGSVKSSVVLGICYTVMLICFYFATPNTMYLIYIIIFGMGCICGGTPHLHPATTISVYGAKEYQSANRYVSIIINLIAAGGISFMSIVKDTTGNLNLAYVIMTIMAIIGTICMFFIRTSYGETIINKE